MGKVVEFLEKGHSKWGEINRDMAKFRRAQRELLGITKWWQLWKVAAPPKFFPPVYCTDYQPALTQADLDSVSNKTPWPAVALIEEELARMRQYLTERCLDAGWDFEPKGRAQRLVMQGRWIEMQRDMHRHVFAPLRLSGFFQFHDGLISFEDVRRQPDNYGRDEYWGVRTYYNYGGSLPILGKGLI